MKIDFKKYLFFGLLMVTGIPLFSMESTPSNSNEEFEIPKDSNDSLQPKCELQVGEQSIEITADNLLEKLNTTNVAAAIDAELKKNFSFKFNAVLAKFFDKAEIENIQKLLDLAIEEDTKCLAVVKYCLAIIKSREFKEVKCGRLKLKNLKVFLSSHYDELLNFYNDTTIGFFRNIDAFKLKIARASVVTVGLPIELKEDNKSSKSEKFINRYSIALFKADPGLFFIKGIDEELAALTAAAMAKSKKYDEVFKNLSRDQYIELIKMMEWHSLAITQSYPNAITQIENVWKTAHPYDKLKTVYSWVAPLMTNCTCFGIGLLYQQERENKIKKWLTIGALGTFSIAHEIFARKIVGKKSSNSTISSLFLNGCCFLAGSYIEKSNKKIGKTFEKKAGQGLNIKA